MNSPSDPNLTHHPPQDVTRLRELRVWMLRNGVTWVDMGAYMTGVQKRRVMLVNHRSTPKFDQRYESLRNKSHCCLVHDYWR